MDYIRIWKEIDIREIQDHIMMVDDTLGHCPACKKVGIPLENLTECPGCNRRIKYITSPETKGGRNLSMIMRMKKKLPELIFVDYNDYEHLTGRKKAEGLFKDI